MWKLLMVAVVAVAVAGTSIVYAQQGNDDRDPGRRLEHRHHRLSPEDRAAFLDARIAALKAGLELTPDQAKNWPAFEQALRDRAQLRAELRAAREAREDKPTPSTPFERMARRADGMARKSAALKRIADAGAPLYQSLNDAQKERFKKLARMLRPHHRQMPGATCALGTRVGGGQPGATIVVEVQSGNRLLSTSVIACRRV